MNDKYVASYSGGKDSTAMILKIWEHNMPLDAIIFFDFGFEFPEIYKDVEHMKSLAEQHGTLFITAKPDHDFEWYAVEKPLKIRGEFRSNGTPKRKFGYGFPNFMRRWCTRVKLNTIKIAKRENDLVDSIDYVGIAADEPKRIKRDDKKKLYPLVDLGITERECLDISRKAGFFQSPHPYDKLTRVSCYCCPLQNNVGIRYLINERPELWDNIKRIEKRLIESQPPPPPTDAFYRMPSRKKRS